MEKYVFLLLCINIIFAHLLNNGKENISDTSVRNYFDVKPLTIIGGSEATPHAFPYQVGIYITLPTRTDFCGGSLISPNYVLTAAHCLENSERMDLIFGAQDITKNESSQIRQSSTRFIIHPEWNTPAYANDIALVELDPPVYQTDFIKFIKISSAKSNWSGETGVIAGWGTTTSDQDNVTPNLRFVNSTIMSHEECLHYDSEYEKILQPSMMCFAGTGIVGSCGGDSGGPLTVNGEQVGIVSFGKKNCTAGYPSVMTRLSEFLNWLKNNSDVNL